MAEHWIVAPGVEGSIPFTHPTFEFFQSFLFPLAVFGGRRRAFSFKRHAGFRFFAGDGQHVEVLCESGGIGRRTGLRIQRATVGVRLPSLAPAVSLKGSFRTSFFRYKGMPMREPGKDRHA